MSDTLAILQNNSNKDNTEDFFRLAPFNPSSQQIQEKALDHLKLSKDDILFDLGCGDGRLLCHAVQHVPGLRCVGIEIDPVYVERAQRRIHELLSVEAQSRMEIRCQDALSVMGTGDETTTIATTITTTSSSDTRHKSISELTLLDDATALYLFVLPKGLQKLLPILEALVQQRIKQQRTLRILSYMFQIHHGDWEPTLVDRTAKGGCPIYYYEWNGIEQLPIHARDT
ncbi:methyltransferase type 11 domain containing protein [Nitzschia inconspicua]|uniref:Methyltransferase type 11 domain containing protein n=1 Tax=Nitzschia inconspicua TaxID=303405 RepID=A0A9K3PG49_9STRA|nr:methyltransferase type 11 domain containing protein [Nitzschia inconspicua]